jgi:hypothetical protein
MAGCWRVLFRAAMLERRRDSMGMGVTPDGFRQAELRNEGYALARRDEREDGAEVGDVVPDPRSAAATAAMRRARAPLNRHERFPASGRKHGR